MSEHTKYNDGGPAFPVPVAQPFGDGWMAVGGMSLRDWFAGRCDVSAYNPVESFKINKERYPQVEELAAYIASIRMMESDAMLAARKERQ